ncbi:MAG: hypothetical protein VR70_02170 [Rhodospirillaceae bacterium BRH_c57]|nr:MAG: hypothetical protein VR70_02170 [Rhodospirillaceae bacterium BRH_c57]
MRTSLIASAALAVPLFAGGALADQHGEAPGATTTTTTTTSPQAQAGAPAGAFELIGKDVIGTGGEEVGQINNVLIDAQGQPTHVVLGHGGWLGMGEKEIALRFDQLQVSREEIRVTMADEQLAAMPEYQSPDEREGAGQTGEAQTGETRPVATPQGQDVAPDAGEGGSRLDATPGVMSDPVKPRPAD